MSSWIRYIFFFILLTLSSLAFSHQYKPDKCPSINALQKHLFITTIQAPTGWLAMQAISRYDTKDLWLFGLAVDGDDLLDAFKNAYKALPTLGYPLGPYDVLGLWFCDYTATVGYGGQARVIR
ncbi:MAG: hypothetical protein ACYCQI_05025 [Gammaproteobacteria bacterium]